MADPTDQLTDAEIAEQLTTMIGGSATPDPKSNVHTFLRSVAESKDTTKTGFLKEEELGNLTLTVRADKELELISREIMKNTFFADFFAKESEITTSTSLSREAKLLELAVVTRREMADVTKPKKENKGWFGRKEKEVTE